MPDKDTKGKFPLTIFMDAEIAKRLAVAAETQKQPAEDLVIQILDRSLPRLQSGTTKSQIPYT
jgi:hypothetical protein